jgi:hypothetical protein
MQETPDGGNRFAARAIFEKPQGVRQRRSLAFAESGSELHPRGEVLAGYLRCRIDVECF